MNLGGRRQAVRGVVIALVATVLLSGCGGGSDGASKPKATPAPPPRTFTLEQLSSVLPDKNQVPDATDQIRECPGADECTTGEVSVAFEVKPSSTTAAGAEQAESFGRLQTVQVTARTATTAAEAVAGQKKARTEAQAYSGTFSTKAKRTSKTSYTFGFKGKGTLEDAVVGQWDGYLLTRDTDLINLSGTVEGPALVTGELALVSGRTTVSVYAGLSREGNTTAAAARLVKRLARDYITRLNLVP